MHICDLAVALIGYYSRAQSNRSSHISSSLGLALAFSLETV